MQKLLTRFKENTLEMEQAMKQATFKPWEAGAIHDIRLN